MIGYALLFIGLILLYAAFTGRGKALWTAITTGKAG